MIPDCEVGRTGQIYVSDMYGTREQISQTSAALPSALARHSPMRTGQFLCRVRVNGRKILVLQIGELLKDIVFSHAA